MHLNVTDFAVAVERLCEPSLRDRPVIVAPLGSPRALVFDMSEEAFRAGVRKHMPLERARRLCRDARLAPPRPHRCERAMAAMLRLARPYSPLIEAEEDTGHLFLDLTGTGGLFSPPRDLARRIRREIRQRLGLDPAWGLAVNKLVAGQSAWNEPWGRSRALPVREHNPFRYVDRLSVERRAKYVPTPQEVKALRLAAGPEFRLYLDILYETAARPAEARILAWEDVQESSLILYTRKSRHGHRVPRRLSIGQELVSQLTSWRRRQGPGGLYVFAMRGHKDRPREGTWTAKQMRAACTRANVDYFPVGCMRHYTASRWAMEGVPFTTIQMRLGHSQATTTNNYLRELQGL